MKSQKPSIQVSNSLKKTLPLLTVLNRLTPKSRQSVINELKDEKVFFNALHELSYNGLKGRSGLKDTKFKPHINLMKKFCSPSNRKCAKKRKRLITQSGGFIGSALISTLLGALASSIFK